MTVAAKTFSLVYRSGGTQRCTWTRVLKTYADASAAQAAKAELEKGGFKALVFWTASLETVGLPVGWDEKTPIDYRDVRYVRADNGTMLQTIHEVR